MSEYDSDCQGQVANGNMDVTDELSQNDNNGTMVDYVMDGLFTLYAVDKGSNVYSTVEELVVAVQFSLSIGGPSQ